MDKDNPFKLEDIFQPFKDLKPPVVDLEGIKSTFEENLEILRSSQKIGVDTTKAIMEIQAKYMKSLMDEWNELVKNNISQDSFKDKSAHHLDVMKEHAAQALAHYQELNALIVKSNEEILSRFQERVNTVEKDVADQVKKAGK
jgi:phasin family protein